MQALQLGLKRLSVRCDTATARLLLARYARIDGNRLAFMELSQMVLPVGNKRLRDEILERRARGYSGATARSGFDDVASCKAESLRESEQFSYRQR